MLRGRTVQSPFLDQKETVADGFALEGEVFGRIKGVWDAFPATGACLCHGPATEGGNSIKTGQWLGGCLPIGQENARSAGGTSGTRWKKAGSSSKAVKGKDQPTLGIKGVCLSVGWAIRNLAGTKASLEFDHHLETRKGGTAYWDWGGGQGLVYPVLQLKKEGTKRVL